jgi:hypothetical protein
MSFNFIRELILVSVITLILLVVPLSPSTSATVRDSYKQPSPVKISTMKAKLFYQDRGTFSKDVIELNPETPFTPPGLWNMYMKGSSENEGPSTSALVTVEVVGEVSAIEPERKIEFIAKYVPFYSERREITVRKIQPIRWTENRKYIAGFWLDEVGCHPVKMTARIIGQRAATTIRGRINIGCGE